MRKALPHLNDQQVIVALARAIAIGGNAQAVYLLRNRTELRRLPIRIHWFDDPRQGAKADHSLWVVRATPEYRDLLRCRVTRIGKTDPATARRAVAGLFAGNESWRDYKSVYYLTSPEILFGLGLVKDMEMPEFVFDCGGRAVTRTLRPLPLLKSTAPVEAWWDLAPAGPSPPGAEWVSALEVETPLYLRRPSTHYWFEPLDRDRTIYFQHNRSQQMPNSERFGDFAKRLLETLASPSVERFVVDLRFNTGGDGGIAAQFYRDIAALDRFHGPGQLVVIIGRATFSAGIFHACQLREKTRSTFIGEPAGDWLDFWAEGSNVVLPNSKLTVHYSNRYHSYSRRDPPELRPYFSDLSVNGDRLQPDVHVLQTAPQFFAGRDSALEAALKPSSRRAGRRSETVDTTWQARSCLQAKAHGLSLTSRPQALR